MAIERARASRLASALALLVLACGPSKPDPSQPKPPDPVADTCATRLPDRAPASAPTTPAPQSAFTAARSTIVVEAEIPLAGVKQALEAKVPRRVAEEKDHDIGVAGRLEYTVDRGPFSLRALGGALVVEAPLLGHVQACAKGRCYAGCAPELKVVAHVPLKLSADYKLHVSEVHFDVIKGCEVRALGGFVTVDVTPVLRSALGQQARTVQASIDRELPNLQPEAARLWTELEKPRDLPLGSCVVLSPEEITQGPASGTVDLARLRFALLAHPEVRVKCGTPAATNKPLPPLRDDPALPALGDVHLAIVLPDEAAARGVERAEPVDFGGRRARIAKASGDVASGLLVELSGEVCGDVAVTATGAAFVDGQTLHLTGIAPKPGEAERLGGAQLDGSRLTAGLEKGQIVLPIAVDALQTMLPELARSMTDDKLTITATVESSKPETAGLRGPSVIAVALLRGAVTLHAK